MVAAMDLGAEDKQRVEEQVLRLVTELRARPTQEKEDALGLQIATMPSAEREYVTTVLLRMLGEDRP
jgi:Holliday junction resolvasome RuvABC endonuclease subunit